MATETADNIKLKEAIIEVSKLSPKDKVRIHNKYYATVNTRNHIFRKKSRKKSLYQVNPPPGWLTA